MPYKKKLKNCPECNKGYELDNIHLVTHQVNVMKNDTSLEDFINVCKLISENNV